MVGNLESDTLIKVDEKVYKVDAASPTNASVISMDTGKKFTINAAYKTEPLGTLGVQVPFQAVYGDHIIIQHEGVEKIVKFLDKEKDEDGLQTGNIHVEFLPSVEDGVAETVSGLGAHRIPASHYAPDGFEVGDQFSKDGKKWTADTAQVKAIAKMTKADAKDVPAAMSLYKFPTAAQQLSATWLGGGAAKAMTGTAAFLKEQGRIQEVKPDYAAFVTDAYVKKAGLK